MKLFRIFALCTIMVFSLAGLASAAVTHISPIDVYNYMQFDPSDNNYIGYLIDIRTPEEWCGDVYEDPRSNEDKNTDGHPEYDGVNGIFLEGRVLNISSHLFSDTGRDPNLDFQWEFENRYAFVTEEPFVLMCASGKRSYGAAVDLDTHSLDLLLGWDVYNMVGGFKGRDCDSFCFDPFYNNEGHCPGWKESWDGFAEGLPFIDLEGCHCGGAYCTVPIPGAIFLLGPGLIGIIGIRRKFMH